jgi:glycosyltransferase involved in cell wall biosynthesis
VTSRLTVATMAVSQPMGQQVYERELAQRAPAELGAGWEVSEMVVRSLRSPLPGTVRLPSALLIGASPSVRRAAGGLVYRRGGLVHRMDLRLPPAPRPEVLTVHDVVPLRFPDEGTLPRDAASAAQRAVVVICPSQFAADEVASQLGVLAPVAIHNGVDQRFFGSTPLSMDELEALGVRPPFVVHAGGCTERKNLAGLADAWPRVRSSRPDATLVLIGPPDDRRDRLFAPLAGSVRVGRVDDRTLRGLMAAAGAVVVPSTYEGFGLPALEGMAVGVPVVASARSSLPEVCGDAAYLVEPDGAGLAEGMIAALDGGPDTEALVARGRLRAKKFTWEASAAAHAAVWRSWVR